MLPPGEASRETVTRIARASHGEGRACNWHALNDGQSNCFPGAARGESMRLRTA